MSYKAASFLILFWGLFMLAGGTIAFYFMGYFANPILAVAGLAGVLGFSVGHFLNRKHKQAFILAVAACMLFVFLLGWLTVNAFSQDQTIIAAEAWATHPQNVSLLVASAMFTCNVFVLALLLIFAKSIYESLQKNPDQL